MADNDSNIIKPVESLQNVPILTPAGRREQRRNRQSASGGHEEKPKRSEKQQNNPNDEQYPGGDGAENENDSARGRASGGIDYCA